MTRQREANFNWHIELYSMPNGFLLIFSVPYIVASASVTSSAVPLTTWHTTRLLPIYHSSFSGNVNEHGSSLYRPPNFSLTQLILVSAETDIDQSSIDELGLCEVFYFWYCHHIHQLWKGQIIVVFIEHFFRIGFSLVLFFDTPVPVPQYKFFEIVFF